MINKVNNNPVGYAKPEPASKSEKFSKILNGFGRFALATTKAAAHFVPGLGAISEYFDMFGLENQFTKHGGMTPTDMLGIQQQMLQEARTYTLISNIMRIRHDAAMNAIRNIK
jgi:hypothetical protein